MNYINISKITFLMSITVKPLMAKSPFVRQIRMCIIG